MDFSDNGRLTTHFFRPRPTSGEEPRVPLRAHKPPRLADRRPVILAEIGNRLVMGNQPTGGPHHLNVAGSLTLKPAARL
jgi:hypothetical protein